jgi:hypothetical protein
MMMLREGVTEDDRSREIGAADPSGPRHSKGRRDILSGPRYLTISCLQLTNCQSAPENKGYCRIGERKGTMLIQNTVPRSE